MSTDRSQIVTGTTQRLALRRVLVAGGRSCPLQGRSLAKVMTAQIMAQVQPQLANVDAVVKREAERAVTELRTKLADGTAGLQPTSAERSAWKARTGKDDVPLVANGEYANAITATQVRPGLYRVTVRNGMHSSGISLAMLSRIHEFGTLSGIPARAHFAGQAVRSRVALTRDMARRTSRLKKNTQIGAHRKAKLKP